MKFIVFFGFVAIVKSQDWFPIPVNSGEDGHRFCCFWADTGECETNLFWMRPICQKSCGTPSCSVEDAESCKVSVNVQDCPWLEKKVPDSVGSPGNNAVFSEEDADLIEVSGEDAHDWCCFWAWEGACENNPYWMRPLCQKSCGTKDCKVENAEECVVKLNIDGCKWIPPSTN